jgi:hypothetical protein
LDRYSTGAFNAGMRGGAPTVAQRLDFNAAMAKWGAGDPAVGLYKLNHGFKGAWFQPLNLSSEKPVSSLCFLHTSS